MKNYESEFLYMIQLFIFYFNLFLIGFFFVIKMKIECENTFYLSIEAVS